MNDAELLSDFLIHQDEQAFEVLVRRHGPMVLKVCRDVLDDSHDVDDAFQATFMLLIRKASSIRDRASLGPWLYEVAWKTSSRARSQAARRHAVQKQVSTMVASATPEADPTRHEFKPVLHDEIHRLPSRLRDAIVLCYLEGFAVEAAAKRLDCPVGTLKSRLSKGREMLRSRLTRRGVGVTTILLLVAYLTDEQAVAEEVPDGLVESTVQSGLEVLKTRPIVTRYLDRSGLGRPWVRRMTSAALALLLLAGSVPVRKWFGLSSVTPAAAATVTPTDSASRETSSDHCGVSD